MMDLIKKMMGALSDVVEKKKKIMPETQKIAETQNGESLPKKIKIIETEKIIPKSKILDEENSDPKSKILDEESSDPKTFMDEEKDDPKTFMDEEKADPKTFMDEDLSMLKKNKGLFGDKGRRVAILMQMRSKK